MLFLAGLLVFLPGLIGPAAWRVPAARRRPAGCSERGWPAGSSAGSPPSPGRAARRSGPSRARWSEGRWSAATTRRGRRTPRTRGDRPPGRAAGGSQGVSRGPRPGGEERRGPRGRRGAVRRTALRAAVVGGGDPVRASPVAEQGQPLGQQGSRGPRSNGAPGNMSQCVPRLLAGLLVGLLAVPAQRNLARRRGTPRWAESQPRPRAAPRSCGRRGSRRAPPRGEPARRGRRSRSSLLPAGTLVGPRSCGTPSSPASRRQHLLVHFQRSR